MSRQVNKYLNYDLPIGNDFDCDQVTVNTSINANFIPKPNLKSKLHIGIAGHNTLAHNLIYLFVNVHLGVMPISSKMNGTIRAGSS